jgi:AcrR family transcriptional regulator
MASTGPAPNAARRRGPAPALEPDAERRALLDAATRVLRRNGLQGTTLDEVLGEAGLGTRSFYRHFSTKDELLLALRAEETAALAARMQKLVDAAPTGLDALEAWIDDLLAIAYDPRRAQRARLLQAGTRVEAEGRDDARAELAEQLSPPLTALLERGRADGSFPAVDVDVDTRVIFTLTFATMTDLEARTDRPTRAQALASILRYALPALGLVRERQAVIR